MFWNLGNKHGPSLKKHTQSRKIIEAKPSDNKINYILTPVCLDGADWSKGFRFPKILVEYIINFH